MQIERMVQTDTKRKSVASSFFTDREFKMVDGASVRATLAQIGQGSAGEVLDFPESVLLSGSRRGM